MKKLSKGTKKVVTCMAIAALFSVCLLAGKQYKSNASGFETAKTSATQESTLEKGGFINGRNSAVILQQLVYNYTGKAVKPHPNVYYKGEKLKENVDYTLKYSSENPVNQGYYYVEVDGIGKMKGYERIEYRIVAAKTITEVPQIPKVDPTVKYADLKSACFIEQCEVKLTQDKYKYTGNEINPIPVVTYKGVPLKPYRDYTVRYQAAINPGYYCVIVTGVDKVIGEDKLAYQIEK